MAALFARIRCGRTPVVRDPIPAIEPFFKLPKADRIETAPLSIKRYTRAAHGLPVPPTWTGNGLDQYQRSFRLNHNNYRLPRTSGRSGVVPRNRAPFVRTAQPLGDGTAAGRAQSRAGMPGPGSHEMRHRLTLSGLRWTSGGPQRPDETQHLSPPWRRPVPWLDCRAQRCGCTRSRYRPALAGAKTLRSPVSGTLAPLARPGHMQHWHRGAWRRSLLLRLARSRW